MGLTKNELFTTRQNDLAGIAKALAHPARIAILDCLKQADQCINGDLVNEIGLAQSTISQHLKELKRVGLIKGTVEGTAMCYCINKETWAKFGLELAAFFGDAVQVDDACC